MRNHTGCVFSVVLHYVLRAGVPAIQLCWRVWGYSDVYGGCLLVLHSVLLHHYDQDAEETKTQVL